MRFLATIYVAAMAMAMVAGCAGGDADTGTLNIGLVQDDGAGTSYRLSAQFTVAGPQGTLHVDADGDAPTLSLALAPGDYTVTLLDGWHLERARDGQPFEPVDAQLATRNQVPVTITPGGAANAVFFFLVPMGNHGDLRIAFGISTLHARLFGTLHATFASGMLAGYVDHPVSFVMAYAVSSEGRVNTPPLLHQVVSGENELRFTDDPLGLFATAPTLSGGSLDYRIEVQPDGSQTMLVLLNPPSGGGGLELLAASEIPLLPKLPTDDLGVPEDPGRVGFTTTSAFEAFAGELGSMTGTLDLVFVPET